MLDFKLLLIPSNKVLHDSDKPICQILNNI